LKDFHEDIDLMPNLPSPADLFGTLKKVYRKADFESRYESDEYFSKVLEKIK